jgi:hypothetical protein
MSWGWQTLSDAAEIQWDLANGNGVVTLGGDRELQVPTNMTAGAMYWLKVVQDATGGRELSFEQGYKFELNVLNSIETHPYGNSIFTFYCDGSSMYVIDVKNDFTEQLIIFDEVGAFNWTVPDGVESIAVVVVGGGGGGGDRVGGGGGAGGVVYDLDYDVSGESSIAGSVGAGGTGSIVDTAAGTDGGNSTFGTLTAYGGGGGGTYNINGRDGASGGGGSGYFGSSIGGLAIDTDPPNDVFQGYDGGSSTKNYGAGGGGGAGEVGENGGSVNDGGDGGDGINLSTYLGISVGDDGWFGGGGGGSGYTTNNSLLSAGGKGGGGNGGHQSYSPTSGTPNTGGGGGGRERSGDAGDGGSGVVIIKLSN